ncbi:hypothetical protein O181_072338 [Austropuccinia psidii MF-1]|uniref:CCHC-type domain-containing protein n=1 Tax=Austropuccinia psidii MF-1 TaxID=1389203 RepID=A0A9Q3F2T9_9BASI|nr:hypothetical protein [Austropuccinia psidii MF-1]
MTYPEKEALKKIPEASSWPKFSVVGEYDHMELIDYTDGLFIDVPNIPDHWINFRLNIECKGHASIWYTETKGIHGRRNWTWWKSQIIHQYRNAKTNKKRVEEVTKKNSCHNCGSTEHFANNCTNAKKKVYAIEQVPEEEPPAEGSESEYMGDAIRENSDDDQEPKEEFQVEYHKDTQLEIKNIQLEAGMAQDTVKKNLCENTQDAQNFLVAPTRGMAYIHGTATKMTVCIENTQQQLKIDSGAHCSIVAREYLDNHFPH